MLFKESNVFFHREKCLEAFRHVGLDIRGGIANIDKARLNSKAQRSGFSTASILVTDAEKVRRYVNIGVHLDATSLMHETPKTLEEAVKSYALLLQLTKENFRTLKEINEDFDEEKADYLDCFDITGDDMAWELRREKFILAVRDRYREVVAEMVMEEKFSALQSDIQHKKRRRLGTS